MDASNLEQLKSWRRSLGDLAPRTVELYWSCLGLCVDWLEENHPGVDLYDVQRAHVEEWFDHQRETPSPSTGEPVGRSTLRSRWIALRSFYNWAVDEDEIDVSPMAKAEPPPVRVITDDEIAALLSVCTGKGFGDRRDAALVRTLAATGARVSEVCSMTVDGLDLDHRIAQVAGKGGKSRFIRFDPDTAPSLDRYVRARARYRTAHLPDLWIGHRGALTRKGVPSILDKRAAQARAAGHEVGHIHAHAFRHRFAHTWLADGGTEGDLQRLGGWTSDQVMRRYGAALADDRALAAYDRLNPMQGI